MSQVEDDVLQSFRLKLEADPAVAPALVNELMDKLATGKLDAGAILATITELTQERSV